MTYPSSDPSRPPAWPHCARGAGVTDPVGCRGVRVARRTACLAHLEETDRAAHLAALSPGADIDHRGTSFSTSLLDRLLDALRDQVTRHPRLGNARFNGARFTGDANFSGADLTGRASFDDAVFTGGARFGGADFTETARFGGAVFEGEARFREAAFSGGARFDGTVFRGNALFLGAVFEADTTFGEARFEATSELGPLLCDGAVDLDGAVFGAPVTLEIAARAVSLRRARWAPKAALRLRYASLDLSDAVLEYPLVVTAHGTPFVSPHLDDPLSETALAGRDHGVRLTSVSGVDTALLALHDIDLSGCRFAGAVHLDGLRVDGWCTFATAPTGWWRRFPWRWSRRRALIEEHHWRARSARRAHGWTALPADAPRDTPELRPAALAALYRQLRKSLEDGKNEPGAADFYFGECEMRRHDRDGTFLVERLLLTVHWALSGYGLRAVRALAWLALAMLVTVTLLMAFGLPEESPKQEITGTVPAGGGKVTFEMDKADPENPRGDTFTGERLEKALNVTLNSVVFRSSGQDLTTAGGYIEMASRVSEPVLLGLAALAVRNRVKR
ncbi:pentapeptide repeat-containing protein [Streptomyces sp. NBC_01498]|uniref:pentapeptide repeat-containing protein n=1 Tax=Streptomyces sp. NBC_01498 TaxID=2975870 RepID=UPI002E7B41C2|nr:pentapeptide repeat-containing protein [Streptomyces sp. NBC_01498]WTL28328.1 pentapeptide repeat-containing protein [Streptomyces sp. NBC_01498]